MAVDLVRSVWEERYKYICVNEKERISAVVSLILIDSGSEIKALLDRKEP